MSERQGSEQTAPCLGRLCSHLGPETLFSTVVLSMLVSWLGLGERLSQIEGRLWLSA